MDLHPNLGDMELDQLLEHQQALTRHRKEVLDAQARVQMELDHRARQIASRRAAEDQLLGAANKPPAQQVFGDTPELEAGS